MSAATCKSTRYGKGCGHPTTDHVGKGSCCCCNWQQNDPAHVEGCGRCRLILAAYAARYDVEVCPVTDRLARARAEIARRRALAEAATPGPWECDETSGINHLHFGQVAMAVLLGPDTYGPSIQDTRHMAANNPTHVLAVLAAADATLDRHWRDVGPHGWCPIEREEGICADLAAVLDTYAPEPQ